MINKEKNISQWFSLKYFFPRMTFFRALQVATKKKFLSPTMVANFVKH